MALFPPPRRTSLFTAQLPKTLGFTKIMVTGNQNNKRQLTVTWPAQKGAVRYVVYAAPSPTSRNRYKEVPKTQTSTLFEFPIIVPEDFTFYFWVAFINPMGKEVFIQEEPGYYLANTAFDPEEGPLSPEIRRDVADQLDSLYRVEDIRRRHLFMLQSDGEEFLLYIRRSVGQRCISLTQEPGKEGRVTPLYTTNHSKLGTEFDPIEPGDAEREDVHDPGYQAHYRCSFCFGTGIAGGYLPSIRIRVRYGNLPKRLIKFEEQGVQFEHTFNSWTTWHPRLKENDVLVRIRTNERFVVKEVGNSELRGITLHQEFNAAFQDRTAMSYEISDERITQALEKESAFNVGYFDWAVWS